MMALSIRVGTHCKFIFYLFFADTLVARLPPQRPPDQRRSTTRSWLTCWITQCAKHASLNLWQDTKGMWGSSENVTRFKLHFLSEGEAEED